MQPDSHTPADPLDEAIEAAAEAVAKVRRTGRIYPSDRDYGDAAVRAAAPIIAAPILAERDEWRTLVDQVREDLNRLRGDLRMSVEVNAGLRERIERYERLNGAVTEWRNNRLDNDAIHAVLTALDDLCVLVPPSERVADLRTRLDTAERDALLRAADDVSAEDEWLYHVARSDVADWLRERAKAADPAPKEETQRG